jgi:uncharacterized protein GlcG (DUF336 family)
MRDFAMRPVASIHALCLAALVMPLAAQAQQPASTPAPTPARGPRLDDALRMAQAALAACKAQGSHVVAVVVDAGNLPVALLADDGSVPLAQQLIPRKTALAIKYKAPSADTAERAKTDTALAAEIRADPKIGFALPGALPLVAGGELIGALAVSGGASPQQDSTCAAAGLAKATVRPR